MRILSIGHWAAALLAAAIATACIQAGGPPAPDAVAGKGEIPFDLAGAGGAAVVVPVSLNGTGPYDFVVDTGATLTCVDDGLAEKLALPRESGLLGRGASIGSAGPVSLRKLDALSVGSARVTGLTVCVVDLANFEGAGLEAQGLLGLNVLKAYRVTFDFKRNMLLLEQ